MDLFNESKTLVIRCRFGDDLIFLFLIKIHCWWIDSLMLFTIRKALQFNQCGMIKNLEQCLRL